MCLNSQIMLTRSNLPSRVKQEAESEIDANKASIVSRTQSQAAPVNGTIDVVSSAQRFLQSCLYANMASSKSMRPCHDPAVLANLQRQQMENAANGYNTAFMDCQTRITTRGRAPAESTLESTIEAGSRLGECNGTRLGISALLDDERYGNDAH